MSDERERYTKNCWDEWISPFCSLVPKLRAIEAKLNAHNLPAYATDKFASSIKAFKDALRQLILEVLDYEEFSHRWSDFDHHRLIEDAYTRALSSLCVELREIYDVAQMMVEESKMTPRELRRGNWWTEEEIRLIRSIDTARLDYDSREINRRWHELTLRA